MSQTRDAPRNEFVSIDGLCYNPRHIALHAPVAQRTEQWFPKPCVVRSSRTRGI